MADAREDALAPGWMAKQNARVLAWADDPYRDKEIERLRAEVARLTAALEKVPELRRRALRWGMCPVIRAECSALGDATESLEEEIMAALAPPPAPADAGGGTGLRCVDL